MRVISAGVLREDPRQEWKQKQGHWRNLQALAFIASASIKHRVASSKVPISPSSTGLFSSSLILYSLYDFENENYRVQ